MIVAPRLSFATANLATLSLTFGVPAPAAASNISPPKVPVSGMIRAPESVRKVGGETGNVHTASILRDMAVRPLKKKIEAFRNLQHGWDGPASVPPGEDAITRALTFVESLSPRAYPPEITAAGDGELSVSWRDADKFIDVSFYDGGATAYSRVNGKVTKLRSLKKFYELPTEAVEALSVA